MPAAADDLPKAFRQGLAAASFPTDQPLALAVSGGPDSMAMAHLAQASGLKATALIFDHELRPNSSAEAQQTAERLARLSLPSVILTWDGQKPETNIQASARNARYAALECWCGEHGIEFLATGHHADDQAETLLLRLARGSGLKGLAAMTPAAPGISRADIRILRPLLAVTKAGLINYCEAVGLTSIDDPSNADQRFDRVKVRQLLKEPPLEGLTAARLARTAEHLARASAAIEHYVDQLHQASLQPSDADELAIDLGPLQQAPAEVGLRLLARLLKEAAGGDYAPRFDGLERVYARLTGAEVWQDCTLGKCLLRREGNCLLITKEP